MQIKLSHKLSRTFAEWFFVAASSFYGSLALPHFAYIILLLVCFCRNFIRKKSLFIIFNGLYIIFILYALDQLSHFSVFLYNAGLVYLLVYVSLVSASGYFFFRYGLLLLPADTN